MTQTIDPAITRIYEAWHDTVRSRDLAGTAALYAKDALLETPLVLAVYPERQSGLICGRVAIKTFFEDSLRKFPSDLAQWYRTGTFFVNGQRLTWDYPRDAPKGEQSRSNGDDGDWARPDSMPSRLLGVVRRAAVDALARTQQRERHYGAAVNALNYGNHPFGARGWTWSMRLASAR